MANEQSRDGQELSDAMDSNKSASPTKTEPCHECNVAQGHDEDCSERPVRIQNPGPTRAVDPARIAKSFNFFLNEQDMAELERLSEAKGMTKSLLMRQAFRLYQLIDKRLSAGEKIYFSGDRGKVETEIIL